MVQKLSEGVYRGRAMPETAKLGTTENGHDQIGFMMQISRGGGHRDLVAMYLVFSDGEKGSARFSVERLRAMGWKGNDLRDLKTIGDNMVDVRISYEAWTNDRTGEIEEKQRAEIVMGVRMDRPMSASLAQGFADRFAKLAAAAPEVAGAAPPKPQNGAAKPPGYVPPEERGDAYAVTD